MIATFSELDRLVRCQLPLEIGRAKEKRESTHAVRGTAIHFFLSHAVQNGREFALQAVADSYPEYLPECESIEASGLIADSISRGATVLVEQGYGIELDEVRFSADRCSNRDDGYTDAQHFDFAGTADVVIFDPTPGAYALTVLDYKTGWSETPADSLQMMAALAAALKTEPGRHDIRLGDFDQVKCRTGVVRVKPDGSLYTEVKEHRAISALMLVSSALQKLKHAVVDGVRVKSGEWCKYCPSKSLCPVQQSALTAVASGDVAESLGVALITTNSAPHILAAVEKAEAVCERLRDELKEFSKLSANSFETLDGKRFGPYQYSEDTMEPGAVLDFLSSTLGLEVATAATKQVVTKASVNAALRDVAVAKGLKVAELQKEVFEKMRAAGAVTKAVTTRVGKK